MHTRTASEWYDDYELWWNGACQRDVDAPWYQRNVINPLIVTTNVALQRPSLTPLTLAVLLMATLHLLLLG